ncbi:MAG: dockerin type I repeat-containing protein, partial [Coriobacteriales bacterium]|nr:dockerin type I repeat-containing protein [Coriobacteriales bacterium]
IQDVYISVTTGSANMIDYQGTGNHLRFAGTSILDMDTGASGYAMVHVNTSTSLTVGGVTDTDTLYFYKREQGAGIGGNGGASGSEGQAPEYNGAITVTGGRLFMKSSKQGACIGSGANASSTTFTPGPITILGGEISIIAVSRSAAIGGSAGAAGGAAGTHVYMEGGTLSINVDFSGSAIGGGGYNAGNDSDGGWLHYSGGSIRAYVDYNAIDPDGDGSASDTLWPGITVPGVYEAAVTADVVDASGTPLRLLRLDTESLGLGAGPYVISSDGEPLYTGDLHAWAFVNESLQKDHQVPITYTIDNWVSLSDTCLYLYLTPESHTLDVNGAEVVLAWDAGASGQGANAAGAFVVVSVNVPDPPLGAASGDVDQDGAVSIADAVLLLRAAIGLDELSPAAFAAADVDGDGVLTMADALITARRAVGVGV